MQDEMNRETFAIVVDSVKMTEPVLANAMKAIIDGKSPGTGGNAYSHVGNVSLKQLADSGMKLSNIEITEKNIKSFEHTAREYGITYALKMDKGCEPPKYIVFFKARDRMQMEAAFKSYINKTMSEKVKEPFSAKLGKLVEKAVSVPVKTPQKEIGGR